MLLRTTDSGATWVPLNALDITKHFWGVAVIGHKVVWVVGDDGFIIKTENGSAHGRSSGREQRCSRR